MKNKISLIVIFFLCIFIDSIYSQANFFTVVEKEDVKLSELENESYRRFLDNSDVVSIEFVKIENTDFSTKNLFLINYKGYSTIAKSIGLDLREKNNIGWFGELTDGTGIFVTEIEGLFFSKFYLGDDPYSIYSLSDSVHLLIRFHQEAVITRCLSGGQEKVVKFNKFKTTQDQVNTTSNLFLADDNCNLRVLILYTTAANNALNMQLISQGMVDETNLAYIQSGVNFRMELARSSNVAYTEVNTQTVQNVYGANPDIQDDLIRVRNGTNGFGNIPALRDLYRADVVALIRGTGLGGNNTFWGQAFGVPTGAFNPAPENGFVLLGNTTSTTLIGGRFSFAHEIAHVQGGRHDNHNATPDYARGFVINNVNNGIRTIMATNQVTDCTNTNTGCRINFFSNPNVQFNGQNVGTATNNNARRLNETANLVRNFRMTNDNLTATAETIANEHTSNHLANSTISTSGSLVYQSGSIGTMRAGSSITLAQGFHANSGSQLRIYTNANPCQTLPVNFNDDEISENRGRAENFNKVKIFPNPGSDYINIEFSKVGIFESLYLTDNLGRRFLDKNIGSNEQVILDVSNLDSGIYFVNFINNETLFTEKVLILK